MAETDGPTLGRTWAALLALVVATAVHLGAQLLGPQGLADASQWVLMPLLALVVWSAAPGPGERLTRLVLLALGFSWLGDTLPDLAGDGSAFLVMVGCFLLAQLAYIAAFWPYRGASVLRRPAVLGYLAVLAALLVACLPGAGSLLVPAVVYGVCLTTMAVLATGVGRLTAAGALVFLASDSLIALDAFASGYALPGHGFWVMATYVGGQGLIAAGALRATRAPASGGTAAAPPRVRAPERS